MSRLPAPADSGVDLLGLSNLGLSPPNSASSSAISTPSTGMTPSTSQEALFKPSPSPPPAPKAEKEPVTSEPESIEAPSVVSRESFQGGAIGDSGEGHQGVGESSGKSMRMANAGFFDMIEKEGGGADFKVTFGVGPVGITLKKDEHGRQCLVKSFRDVKDPATGRMVDGPAKRSGLIAVGDVITEIDGESVMELTFKQTMMRLRQAQDREHTLTFKNPDHIHDLSRYGGDVEMKETRRLIHRQKERWYTSPSGAQDDLVYCYVERKRGQHVTSFNLHREDTGKYMFTASFRADMTGTIVFHTYPDAHMRK
ncbi:hypothetical protein TrCOL_g5391, partial [Triparma columacea]